MSCDCHVTHHARRGTSLGVHPMGIGDGGMEDTMTLVVPERGRLNQNKVLFSNVKTMTVHICVCMCGGQWMC